MGAIRVLLLAFSFLTLFTLGVLALRLLFPRRLQRDEERGGDVSLVQDPYCGRFLAQGEAVTGSFGSEVVSFCSRECRDRYAQRSTK